MPSDNVVILDVVTKLDIPVDRVLDGARDAKLSSVILMGWTADGEEMYFGSSFADGGEALWLLEKAKKALLEM